MQRLYDFMTLMKRWWSIRLNVDLEILGYSKFQVLHLMTGYTLRFFDKLETMIKWKHLNLSLNCYSSSLNSYEEYIPDPE